MYGIFLEEINHGVDGGLYGELVRNRAFEDSRPPEGYTFQNGKWRNPSGFDWRPKRSHPIAYRRQQPNAGSYAIGRIIGRR